MNSVSDNFHVASQSSRFATIVLMPGMDGTGLLLQPLAQLIKARFRKTIIVRYSCTKQQSIVELARELERQLKNEVDVVLVAESFSGPIALCYAATNPSNLRRLILFSSFAQNPMQAIISHLPLRLLLPYLFASKRLIRYFLLEKSTPPSILQSVMNAIRLVEPSVLTFRLRQLLTLENRRRLDDIRVPLLSISGRQDRLLRGRVKSHYISGASSAQIVEIGGPHLLLLVRPEEAAELIWEYCKGLAAGSTGYRSV